jgi:hypothetical protein
MEEQLLEELETKRRLQEEEESRKMVEREKEEKRLAEIMEENNRKIVEAQRKLVCTCVSVFVCGYLPLELLWGSQAITCV